MPNRQESHLNLTHSFDVAKWMTEEKKESVKSLIFQKSKH